MLLLNLARIRTPDERFDLVYAPEEVAADGDSFTVQGPVTLGFDIHKDEDRFHLVGRVRAHLGLPCGRCLEPFEWPVDAAFDLQYVPRVTAAAGAERKLDDEDFSTAVYDDEAIDLGLLVREQCYLSVPMKPLCGEGCRGLCAQCGTNLNLGTCACVPRADDPRLAALRELRSGGVADTGGAPKN
jgi:uncharacterized protein